MKAVIGEEAGGQKGRETVKYISGRRHRGKKYNFTGLPRTLPRF